MFEGWSRILFEFFLAENILKMPVRGWECAYDPITTPDDDPRCWFDHEHVRWSPLTDKQQAFIVLDAALDRGWNAKITIYHDTKMVEVLLARGGINLVEHEDDLCYCICTAVARAFISFPEKELDEPKE